MLRPESSDSCDAASCRSGGQLAGLMGACHVVPGLAAFLAQPAMSRRDLLRILQVLPLVLAGLDNCNDSCDVMPLIQLKSEKGCADGLWHSAAATIKSYVKHSSVSCFEEIGFILYMHIYLYNIDQYSNIYIISIYITYYSIRLFISFFQFWCQESRGNSKN